VQKEAEREKNDGIAKNERVQKWPKAKYSCVGHTSQINRFLPQKRVKVG
jgi:hypothetical protein